MQGTPTGGSGGDDGGSRVSGRPFAAEMANDRASALISELTQGQELMMQLKVVIDQSRAPPQCSPLVHGVQTSLERAISIARSSSDSGGADTDSPRSVGGSLRSENSGRMFRDRERKEMCKKRKALPRWTSQVRVSSATGMEVPEDGFSWRKYGQKDILGAKHPRAYYRCSNRDTQGCPATKQVQRSDQNPTVLDVAYRGDHVCLPRGSSSRAAAPEVQRRQPPAGDSPVAGNPLLLSFKAGLTVKTEEGPDDRELHSPPFSFPSTPLGGGSKQRSHVFSPPSIATLDPMFMGIGGFSPPFTSPAADAAAGILPVSPRQMSGTGGSPRFNPLESEPGERVSGAAYAPGSPVLDLDFMMNTELDQNFPFDSSFFFN